jgi:hypothetical protein
VPSNPPREAQVPIDGRGGVPSRQRLNDVCVPRSPRAAP